MAPFIILTGIGILMIIAYLIVDGMKQKGRNPEEWKDEAEIRSIRRHRPTAKNNKTQPADDTSLSRKKGETEWYDTWIETQLAEKNNANPILTTEPVIPMKQETAAEQLPPKEDGKADAPDEEPKEVYQGRHAAVHIEEAAPPPKSHIEPVPAAEPAADFQKKSKSSATILEKAENSTVITKKAEEVTPEQKKSESAGPTPLPFSADHATLAAFSVQPQVISNPAENDTIDLESITWREPEPQQSGITKVFIWVCGLAIGVSMLLTGWAAIMQFFRS
jgi:hypothetical protein